MRRASPALARRVNRAAVLRLIRERGPISRAEVAAITGLARNSVGHIFDALRGEGLIVSRGYADAGRKGGRRRELWAINPDGGYVAALDLERSRVEAGLVRFDGTIVLKRRRTPRPDAGRQGILDAALRALDAVLEARPRAKGRFFGVGVATFGRLDPKKEVGDCYGIVPDWRNVPLKAILEERAGREVTLDTNEIAAALAEQWFGAARDARNFAVLLFRTGIGAGLCANGAVLDGATGRAGELGHITVDEDGPLCDCGSRGCLEAVASRTALRRRLAEAKGERRRSALLRGDAAETATLDSLIAAARQGDALAAQLLRETARHVGVALANVVCLLDPELITIGPALSRAGEEVIEQIAQEARARIPGADARTLDIRPTPLGDDLVLLGAATLVFSKMLYEPAAASESS